MIHPIRGRQILTDRIFYLIFYIFTQNPLLCLFPVFFSLNFLNFSIFFLARKTEIFLPAGSLSVYTLIGKSVIEPELLKVKQEVCKMEKAMEKNLQDNEVKEEAKEEKQALDADQLDQVSGGLTNLLPDENGNRKPGFGRRVPREYI